jgi:Cys-tRNA(Pro)/Cys-tRNA(Cys) deacylase
MSNEPAEATPVTEALDKLGIPYQFFKHPGQVHSLEQAALERGQRPEQIIRSIVFRLPEGTFVMVLSAGAAQLSWSRLRDHLETKRMTMATPAEVQQQTGYQTGSVSPFGLPQPMRILVDNKVLEETEVSIGSGLRNTTVILSRDNLVRALGEVEYGNFLES